MALPANAYTVSVSPSGSTRGGVVFYPSDAVTGDHPYVVIGRQSSTIDNIIFGDVSVKGAPASDSNATYWQHVAITSKLYYWTSTGWSTPVRVTYSPSDWVNPNLWIGIDSSQLTQSVGINHRIGIAIQVDWYNQWGTRFVSASFWMGGNQNYRYRYSGGNQDLYGANDIACAWPAYTLNSCTPWGVVSGLYAINTYRSA